MKVIFLGTNGWYDTEAGNTVCTLIRTEAYDIVLDAGNGIHRLEGLLDGTKPAYLLLSNFHVDHSEGFHILMKLPFSRGLLICGPEGSRQVLGTFINTPFTAPLSALPYPARIIEMPAEAAALPFPVESFPLRHTSLTLGYRIRIDGRTVAYCPDTGYCENAVALSRSADLLITECAYRPGQSSEAWPHLNPETAARIATEAGAKRLVLTHYDAGLYRGIAERREAGAVAAGIFPAATAAMDGLEISL
ncbi:MAG: ribonuclease Z [Deltaproteobacteria bacterium]|nr:ribonuclease Z [Deltaproteobacteria bacterium]